MDVGVILEAALKVTGGSQAELSRRLGVSQPTISRWYSGHFRPDYESALRLAKLTGFPADQVLRAAGHDVSLLPESVVPTTPEAEEILARMQAIEMERKLREIPEPHREKVRGAVLTLMDTFRLTAVAA